MFEATPVRANPRCAVPVAASYLSVNEIAPQFRAVHETALEIRLNREGPRRSTSPGNRPVEASNNPLFRVEEREIHNRARMNVAVGQSDLQFSVDPLPGLAETGVTDAASQSW